MRCFEAMGCGAMLVSDAGSYPPGMDPGVTIETYDTDQAVKLVSGGLDNWPLWSKMAAEGRRQVSELYSKSLQWKRFIDLVAQA
jgi:hypothetical protein